MKITDLKIALIISTIFFFFGVFTLPHYGINWDTINHLPRGQAYLNYFLTGEKNYSSLPKWKQYWQNPDTLSIDTNLPKGQRPTRSFYKNDSFNYTNVVNNVDGGGHPPLSDILSSLFNVVLFEKLGLINDVDAYRVYGIFLTSALVGLLFFWVSKLYGRVAGLIAALSLATYPLFWSEAHFNTEKDIPETVYWSFMLFAIWKGVSEKKYRWLLGAGIFSGLALGTKFNILFSPFIVISWIVILILINLYKTRKVDIKGFLNGYYKQILAFLTIPMIAAVIFFLSWPFLWTNTVEHLKEVLKFYKTIGLTSNINTDFLGPLGTNTYPLKWILLTTPPIVLLLALIGVLFAIYDLKKDKDKTVLIFFLWLAIPILRITWPGTTVYGGIRQIMEYIPALAIFSGVGGGAMYFILKRFIPRLVATLIVFTLFIPHLVVLSQIHPNENVYFNSLTGGLSGAKKQNIPFWGNSFGAAYRQGIIWLNNNVPSRGKVVFARELMPNIPVIWIRPDINFHNSYRSGYLQKGEYAIGLTYQGTKDVSYYDGYLEMFLNPVYEVQVDGVSILKIWKNDKEHLKVDTQEKVLESVVLTKDAQSLTFDLGDVKRLSRLEIDYDETSCSPLGSGIVQLSVDGKDFGQQWGALPRQWRVAALGEQPQMGHFIEPFLGQYAKIIRLILSPVDTCLKNVINFRVYFFLKL